MTELVFGFSFKPDAKERSLALVGFVLGTSVIVLLFVLHILSQLVFRNKNEPPLVFSFVPFLGSTLEYGRDPYKFFFKNRQKFGNVFTFVLLGKKHTVCLGPEGNDFVLNGKLSELSSAEVYRGLTVPIFGKGVCYDVLPAKFIEQKKFLKYSLTLEKLQSYIPIFIHEVQSFLAESKMFKGQNGVFDVVETLGVITIFTASRSLQGKEVRNSFDAGLADLYHDLDMGLIPINFFYPWLPLPVNRRRDQAQRKIAAIYKSIISARRKMEAVNQAHENDMIWNLMKSKYKDGTPVPDDEIAHMMIGLLMAGQHTSSSIAAWILLRLATRPDVQEALFLEQAQVLGPAHASPTCHDLGQLALHQAVVRETLRLHSPIHSILRAVKQPLTIVSQRPGSCSTKSYSIPPSHVLISAPGVTAQSTEFFTNPGEWDPHRWESLKDLAKVTHRFNSGNASISKSPCSHYLPFGAGRHRCIGEQFAFLQLSMITALLVREFKFRNLAGQEGLVPTDYKSLFTKPTVPAKLEWHRRSEYQELSSLGM